MDQTRLEGLLKHLQSQPESECIEFKVNNCSPEVIGEYISALSNSCCYHLTRFGYLIFGIEDGTRSMVGTDFRPKERLIGNQELENWLSTQLNPRIDFSIFEIDYNDCHFVIFEINATTSMPVSFKGCAFIRVGSYKKKLDEHPEKERKLWNLTNQYCFEKEISLFDVSSDDVLNLIDYPSFFDLLGYRLPDNRTGIMQKLESENLIVFDGPSIHITNLGGLLFAKNIEAFPNLSRKAIRFIIYEGNNRTSPIKEIDGQKGYAVGFKGLIQYISSNIPSQEYIADGIRQTKSDYPIIAIRELVANAIIHQDLTIKGTSPMIEIFANRIEITNPGKPLIDAMRFLDHTPISRNEILARCMRRMKVCEERGSGIDKVISECEKNILPAPEFVIGDTYTRVILYKYRLLRDLDKRDKIRACYLHSCLKYVSGEYMTNQTLRERFNIEESNYPMASRIIADTIDAQLIKLQDPDNKSKKFARYVPYWF